MLDAMPLHFSAWIQCGGFDSLHQSVDAAIGGETTMKPHVLTSTKRYDPDPCSKASPRGGGAPAVARDMRRTRDPRARAQPALLPLEIAYIRATHRAARSHSCQLS